jgi:hypothetical protein
MGRKDPDQAIADLHGKRRHAEFRHLVAEQFVRNGDDLAAAVVGPAVIETDESAALDLAARQLDLAMRAAVLDRVHGAVRAAEYGDRALPECDLDDLSLAQLPVDLDRVPVARIEPGGACLLAQIGGALEAGRRAVRRRELKSLRQMLHDGR